MEEQATDQQKPVTKNAFAVLALKELSKVDKGIAKLQQTYANVVYDVTTTKGMEQAKKARQAIREPRYAVERIRKEEASRIKAAQTELNAEAARITDLIRKIEDPIDAQITAEEERKQREKEEAERKEQERIDAIKAKIEWASGAAVRAEADGLPVEEIQKIIASTSAGVLNPEFFAEFLPEAEFAKAKVLNDLHTLVAKIQLREEEAAKAKAQQEEIEALRRQLAEAQALLAAQAQTPVVTAVSGIAAIGIQIADSALAPVDAGETNWKEAAIADVTHVAVDGVVESLHKGQPIDPATESWAAQANDAAQDLPIDIADVDERRLFEDGYPGTDKIVFAVLTAFGTSEEIAKRYIIEAGNDLAFQG